MASRTSWSALIRRATFAGRWRPADQSIWRQFSTPSASASCCARSTVTKGKAFDAAYAVRSIADIVPNSFTAWGLIDALVGKLRGLGWTDAETGRHASFIIEELRKVLAAERDNQSAALFAAGLESGAVQFALRGDDRDWRAPATIPTAQAEGAAQLTASNGGPLERSLFLPIYRADLNDAEQSVAVYLDRYDAVRWWHRNGSTRGNYGLRGWRRGNVYPDFLIAAARDEAESERVVVMETKGEQLAGNHDTEYKRALLASLTTAFDRDVGGGDQLNLAEPFTFGAAVVMFDDLDAQFPALIRGS